jgi:hypothetical protein
MKMSFSLWLQKGWLKEHKPTSREIAELLAVADRSLKDCQVAGLSSDGKLVQAWIQNSHPELISTDTD